MSPEGRNGVAVAVAPAPHEATHVGGGPDDIDSALAGAAIPNLAASKITSLRFPIDRLPAMTDEKIWKGTGGNVEEIDVPTGVPSGGIIVWHGTIANIPAGYVICDGNNSTPNLLAKFIEGVATAATDPGATGGSTLKELRTGGETSTWTYDANWQVWRQTTDKRIFSSNPAGSNLIGCPIFSEIDDIRPLYYDIAFIMKT